MMPSPKCLPQSIRLFSRSEYREFIQCTVRHPVWCVHKLAELVSRSLYECVTGPSVVSLQLYHRPLPLWRTARGLGGETTHGGDRGRGRSE